MIRNVTGRIREVEVVPPICKIGHKPRDFHLDACCRTTRETALSFAAVLVFDSFGRAGFEGDCFGCHAVEHRGPLQGVTGIVGQCG